MFAIKYTVLLTVAVFISTALCDQDFEDKLSKEHLEVQYIRLPRGVSFPGIPQGGRVFIPNWNPNVKTSPWQTIEGRKPRSVEFDFVTDRTQRLSREPADVEGGEYFTQ